MHINISDIPDKKVYVKITNMARLSFEDTSNLKLVNNKEFIIGMDDEAKKQLFKDPPDYNLYKNSGGYPEEKVDQAALKWEMERPKIKNRTIYSNPNPDPNEIGSELDEMGAIVVQKALLDAGIKLNECDLLMCATNNSRIYPANAQFIKGRVERNLGIISHSTGCVDIRAACPVGSMASFLASGLIRSKQCKRIILVIVDKATDFGDPKDYTKINLFGDGAVALMFEASFDPADEAYISFNIQSLTENNNLKLISHSVEEHYFDQKGHFVFRIVGTTVLELTKQALDQSPLTPQEKAGIKWIFHQASGVVSDLIEENIYKYIPEFKGKIYRDEESGNTSAVSTFLLISKLIDSGEIKAGDIICSVSFGASFELVITLWRV